MGMPSKPVLGTTFSPKNLVTLAVQDCVKFLKSIPDNSAQLVITSPPYNIGKSYELRRSSVSDYVASQQKVINEAVRILRPGIVL
jgi:adenine-specific DNA-methyltransferase